MKISDISSSVNGNIINEKRSLWSKFKQMAGSLFSDEKMADRAKSIVADQYENEWRSSAKSAAANENLKWIPKEGNIWHVRYDHLINFFVNQGINKQVAETCIKNAVGSKFTEEVTLTTNDGKEYKTREALVKDNDETFFLNIIHQLWDRKAIVIEDPDGLLKKVKGEVGSDYASGDGEVELTDEEKTNDMLDKFSSWANSSGKTLPESRLFNALLIMEDDEDDSNIVTMDDVKKFIGNEYIDAADENTKQKINALLDTEKLETRDDLDRIFKKVYNALVHNFVVDKTNNKVRTTDDSQKIVDIAIASYEELHKENPDAGYGDKIEKIKQKMQSDGPQPTLANFSDQFKNDGIFKMNDETGEVETTNVSTVSAEETQTNADQEQQESDDNTKSNLPSQNYVNKIIDKTAEVIFKQGPYGFKDQESIKKYISKYSKLNEILSNEELSAKEKIEHLANGVIEDKLIHQPKRNTDKVKDFPFSKTDFDKKLETYDMSLDDVDPNNPAHMAILTRINQELKNENK